jgi:histidine triad (HIT) family protein
MSIFSKIAAGEIPSYCCAQNDEFYAFLDINPLQKGHTLVIPRREVDYIFDLEDDEIGRMHVFAAHVARAIKQVIPCVKVGVAVLGLEVPHAHIHLVPMQSEKDMRFTNPKLEMPAEEMQATADAIRKAFESEK